MKKFYKELARITLSHKNDKNVNLMKYEIIHEVGKSVNNGFDFEDFILFQKNLNLQTTPYGVLKACVDEVNELKVSLSVESSLVI